MSIYSKMLPKIENRDYETHFWNAMRGKAINRETLNNGVEPTTDAYTLFAKRTGKRLYPLSRRKAYSAISLPICEFMTTTAE